MKSKWIIRDKEAVVGAVRVVAAAVPSNAVGLGEERLMYWTPTCWRSNWGFLGLTARMMIRAIARAKRRRKEKRRKRQQQQPLKEALEEEEGWYEEW